MIQKSTGLKIDKQVVEQTDTCSTKVIPFSKVDCSGNESEYIRQVLESGWLTTASKALLLEDSVKQITGAEHAMGVNSCTSALHLALEALGVSPGDKVLVPTMTFTASAEVIRYLGADPVFLDVDYGTGSLTPELVEQALIAHPDAKVLVVVHFGGQAAPMLDSSREGIISICKRHGIKVLEDAAHAFPARDQNQMVGVLGDVTCLSFYANKTITTGEGGMVLTNDDKIAERVRMMRLHGIDRSIWNRFTASAKSTSWEYDVLAPGFKYNMADLNAAVGIAQLERLEDMRSSRQRVAQRYLESLNDIESLDLPAVHVPMEHHAWHLFRVVIKPDAPIDRNEFIQRLNDAGIGTSVHYKPLHRMTYYRERYGLQAEHYPQAERLWAGTVSMPIFSLLEDKEVQYIVEKVRSILL